MIYFHLRMREKRKMSKLRSFNFLILVAIGSSSFAASSEIAQQNVFGQLKDSPYEKADKKTAPADTVTLDDLKYKKNPRVGGHVTSDESWLDNFASGDQRATFQGENEELTQYKNEELANLYTGKSKDGISFSYIYDTYTYSDSANVYERTFRNDDSAKSIQSGYLTFSYKRKFLSGAFSLLGDLSLSVAYASGKGLNAQGDLSRTSFQFWTVPLEYMLGARVSLGRYMNLNLFGGPAVAFVIQNRNDRERGAQDKKIQQFGYGYSGYASLDFSLTKIYPNYGIELMRSSDITDLSVSVMAKTTSLGNFKDEDFEITGTSLGISFNFEYL